MLKENYTWKELNRVLLKDNFTIFNLCNDGILSPDHWKEILREEMTNPKGAKTKIEAGILSYDTGNFWTFEKMVDEKCQEKLFSCKFKRIDIERYVEKAGARLFNKPDHNYWYRRDLWTFWETVWLLCDIDPRTEQKQGEGFSSHKAGYPLFKEKTLSEFGLNPDDHELPENLNLLFSIYESGNDRDLLFKSIRGLEDLPEEIKIIPSAVLNYLYHHKNVAIPNELKPLGDIIINKTEDSLPQASEPKEKHPSLLPHETHHAEECPQPTQSEIKTFFNYERTSDFRDILMKTYIQLYSSVDREPTWEECYDYLKNENSRKLVDEKRYIVSVNEKNIIVPDDSDPNGKLISQDTFKKRFERLLLIKSSK